jgi:hypothetical protein
VSSDHQGERRITNGPLSLLGQIGQSHAAHFSPMQ